MCLLCCLAVRAYKDECVGGATLGTRLVSPTGGWLRRVGRRTVALYCMYGELMYILNLVQHENCRVAAVQRRLGPGNFGICNGGRGDMEIRSTSTSRFYIITAVRDAVKDLSAKCSDSFKVHTQTDGREKSCSRLRGLVSE